MFGRTAMGQIRTDLFNGGAKETGPQSLVGNVSNDSREAFQHLRYDDCGRLGRQHRQETSMYCPHHPTDDYRQWSECSDAVLVTEIQPVDVNYLTSSSAAAEGLRDALSLVSCCTTVQKNHI